MMKVEENGGAGGGDSGGAGGGGGKWNIEGDLNRSNGVVNLQCKYE